jgi:hypothetical protein
LCIAKRSIGSNMNGIKFSSNLYLALILIATGCTNSAMKSLSNQTSLTTNTGGVTGGTGQTAANSLVISNVKIAAGTGQTYLTSIFFNTSKSSGPVSNFCNTATSGSAQNSKSCVCQYTWNESNPNSGSSVAISRTVQQPVTNAQPALITCNAPEVYSTEIANGTQIKITVLPGPSNSSSGQFEVSIYNFTKTSSDEQGSFSDSQGQIFDNISHYACYQTFTRGMTITSKSTTQTNSTTGSLSPPILYASQFCVSSASGNSTSTSGCPNMPPPDFSSQAYYYSLYVRKTEKGSINQSNSNFFCPRVVESLDGKDSTGVKGAFWPGDETFALSLGATSDFNVGVEANVKLAGTQDPTSSNSSCFPGNGNNNNQPAAGAASGFKTGCLGFATRVNSDGTCPYMKDSAQQLRPTYRLRRYVALYPRVFDTNGSPVAGQAQGVDTIYVLDRPVRGPSSADPLKPYTMLGPKPCPFAFYDRKAVTGSRGYKASSNTSWADKNVDGIELPNIDGRDSNGNLSCSAVVSILSSDRSYLSLSTVNINNGSANALNHAYIRPTQPFTPHYEEDTDFQACAPQAAPLKEAPLHFSREPISGNVAWCTESYPTQNPYIKSVDPAASGTVNATGTIPPFTSHLTRNSASTSCSAQTLSEIVTADATVPPRYVYPTANPTRGYGRHSPLTTWENGNASLTCDRTVQSTDLTWTRFPLLAPAADVELAINQDSSYMCTVTYDNGNGKTLKYTPSDGCCSATSVSVCSGFSACSDPLKQIAHLEPDVPCGIPRY